MNRPVFLKPQHNVPNIYDISKTIFEVSLKIVNNQKVSIGLVNKENNCWNSHSGLYVINGKTGQIYRKYKNIQDK